jgi:hypothetical protein
MSEEFSNTLLMLALVAGCCSAWGVSTGAVYWDLRRTRKPDGELAAWLALVALIPGVGLLAYLTWRLLGAFLTPPENGSNPPGLKKRVTAVQRPEGLPPRKTTIPAAELMRATIPEPEPDLAQAAGSNGFALLVDAGPHAAQTFPLAVLPATIGRGSSAGVRLDDDLGVSRRHAELYLQGDILRIRDLGSTHGTLVNGFSISDKGLEPGDRIRVGTSELVLESDRKEGM